MPEFHLTYSEMKRIQQEHYRQWREQRKAEARAHIQEVIDRETELHRQCLQSEEFDYLNGVIIPEGFTVQLTCACVPEQWDIFFDNEMIGYLRCRYSKWSLHAPDYPGETLIAEPWHPERGQYESNFDDERPEIFDRVFRALVEWKVRQNASKEL